MPDMTLFGIAIMS